MLYRLFQLYAFLDRQLAALHDPFCQAMTQPGAIGLVVFESERGPLV